MVLEQKDGSSMLEASERHVGEMSVCMSGVTGAYRPFWEGGFQKRMSSRQKGKSVRRLREFGVWSLVFIQKKEEVNSECFRRKRTGTKGIY